jgi:hypothetical protein
LKSLSDDKTIIHPITPERDEEPPAARREADN